MYKLDRDGWVVVLAVAALALIAAWAVSRLWGG